MCSAVLTQEYNGAQLPVAYASRAFTQGESNISTTEQELAAIHWAIKHFRPYKYIYGRRFLVKTDHRPLTYLFSMKDPTSKLTRMRLDLEDYQFTVEYLKGKDNHVAEALSRVSIGNLIEINRNILMVQPRSLQNKNKEPNVYEVINNNDVKKFVNLKFNNLKCLFKHGKRIISQFSVNDFYSKRKFDLGQFFSKLNSEAGLQNIVNIKLSPSEQIFEFVSLN